MFLTEYVSQQRHGMMISTTFNSNESCWKGSPVAHEIDYCEFIYGLGQQWKFLLFMYLYCGLTLEELVVTLGLLRGELSRFHHTILFLNYVNVIYFHDLYPTFPLQEQMLNILLLKHTMWPLNWKVWQLINVLWLTIFILYTVSQLKKKSTHLSTQILHSKGPSHTTPELGAIN